MLHVDFIVYLVISKNAFAFLSCNFLNDFPKVADAVGKQPFSLAAATGSCFKYAWVLAWVLEPNWDTWKILMYVFPQREKKEEYLRVLVQFKVVFT